MSADVLAEERRNFTIEGWLSGVARAAERRWMRRARDAADLLGYFLEKLKSHGRVDVRCRTTTYRAVTYARNAGVSRWTARRRLVQLVQLGLIDVLGGRESLKVTVRPPPGIEISPDGHAVRTPRTHRRKARRIATNGPRKLGATLLPVELARSSTAGWPNGSKRAYYDWLHAAQNSSTPETLSSPIGVDPTQSSIAPTARANPNLGLEETP